MALYLLRCKAFGFSLDELEEVEIGMIFDMMTEQLNDQEEYPKKASKEDFMKFARG